MLKYVNTDDMGELDDSGYETNFSQNRFISNFLWKKTVGFSFYVCLKGKSHQILGFILASGKLN
jgi:hypothetical protein